MERRRDQRRKKRITCELTVDGRLYRGIVLDLSPNGLFVKTDATPAPGTPLRVTLREGDGDAFELDTAVARKRMVPRHLASITAGGLGLQVANAPEAYYQLLESLGLGTGDVSAPVTPSSAPETSAKPESPTGRERSFRVRVKQSDGPRSRQLRVVAEDAAVARERALEELGPGWDILEVEPL